MFASRVAKIDTDIRGMALSVSYWSPMEKLILHLSPVARRRTLKNNNNNKQTSSLGRPGRHRNRSEPNRASSLRNVNCVYTENGSVTVADEEPSQSIDCDVKTLRLYCINQVSQRCHGWTF